MYGQSATLPFWKDDGGGGVGGGGDQGLQKETSPAPLQRQAGQGTLALHETQAPVGRHDWAADNAGELIQHIHGTWPQQEIEVQDAANCSELQSVAGDGNFHAIAVHEHDSMGQAACKLHCSAVTCLCAAYKQW